MKDFVVDVDFNNNDLINVDSVSFNTSSTHSIAQGVMRWESSDGTLALGINANLDLQIGQENIVRVYNGSGSNIAKGAVVYITGAQGSRPDIRLADADSEATSSKTIGITAEIINNATEGFVTTFGMLRGVDTSAFAEGAALWLSSTAGGITSTKPSAPVHAVFVGFCVKSNSTSGEIFVNIANGYEIEELHNVAISSPANGQVLMYNSTTSVWENTSIIDGGTA